MCIRDSSSSPQAQCGEEGFPDELFDREGPEIGAAAPLRARAALGPLASDGKNDPNHLIDALAGSDAATRGYAAEALIHGIRQFQFEQVATAVIDLYQRLSRAGR